MEKIEKNVRYIVTTVAEDEWFREWADKQGYVWASGHSLLEVTYYDYEINEYGYVGYTQYKDNRNIYSCSGELKIEDKVIYVKDLMKKGENNMNWKEFCVEANTFEEALEKWKKGLTVAKEEPDYTVKIDGNKTTVTTKDGKVGVARCNPEDRFDVAEGIRVALEHIEMSDIELSQDATALLKLMRNYGVITIMNERFVDWDIISGFDENDKAVFSFHDEHNLFGWMKYDKEYNIDKLLTK